MVKFDNMKKGEKLFLAAVTVLIHAEDEGTACDSISALLTEVAPNVIDWGYLSVGGRHCSPMEIGLCVETYEEGDLFKL